MNIAIEKDNLKYIVITSILAIFSIFLIFFDQNEYLSVCTTFLNLLFIFKFKKDIPVFILFVFIFLYSNTFNYYFVSNYYLSVWPDFQTKNIIKTVLINHFIFIFFLGNLIPINKFRKYNFDLIFQTNKIIYIFFIITFFLFLFLGIKGENIFISGLYADSESMKKTTFHEYNILIYLFILINSPKSRFFRLVNLILILIFIFKTLLYGGRIEVIQISLLYFYFYYVFKSKVSYKSVIIFSIFAFFLLHIFENIRNNPSILIYLDFYSIFDFTNLYQLDPSKIHVDSNQGDVIQSSARMLGLIENGYLTIDIRIFSFIINLFSTILPSFLLPDFSNLSVFKQDLYNSGGGGLISTYFFVWFGYLGPVIASIFIALIIGKIYTTKNRYLMIYIICILITFPRWFAYNPIHLFKFCIYAIIIYWIINQIKKEKKNESTY